MSNQNLNSRLYSVVLKLSRTPVLAKIENARHYTTMMAGNPHFTAPSPTLADVANEALLLEQAWEKSRDGSKTAMHTMRNRERQLDLTLIKLSHYVQDVANSTGIPAEVITSAGMQYKAIQVPEQRTFTVKHGKVQGSVKAVTRAESGKTSYVWEYRPKGTADWTQSAITVNADHLFTSLSGGTAYEFRYRTITSDGPGNWSDVKELRAL